MKKLLKAFPLILVLASLDVSAAQKKQHFFKKSSKEKVYHIGEGPGHAQSEAEMMAGYSAPGRFHATGQWDFFFSGSFLYWYVVEDGLSLGRVTNSNTPPNEFPAKGKFQYKPGFKVAAGTNFGYDNWTGVFEYTRIHATTHRFIEVPRGNNSQLETGPWWLPFTPNSVDVNSTRGKWDADLDIADFELARAFYSGLHLICRPFMGIRAAWVDQKFQAAYIPLPPTGQQEVRSRYKSEMWGVGPRVGLDMNWEVFYGFRWIGSLAASMLYQHYVTDVRVARPDLVDIFQFTMRDNDRSIRPNAEASIGMGWGSYFGNSLGHLDILVAYEFHYWWDQNRMRQVADTIQENTCNIPGDLMYHGLTTTLRLDF